MIFWGALASPSPVCVRAFGTCSVPAAPPAAAATLAPAATGVGAVHMRCALDCRREQLRRDGRKGDLVPDVILDVRERHRRILAREADGISLGSGARGAADAMHIVGGILRQIEV